MSATGRGAAQSRRPTRDRDVPVISAHGSWCSRRFTEVRHLSRWWGPEGFTTHAGVRVPRRGEWDFVIARTDGRTTGVDLLTRSLRGADALLHGGPAATRTPSSRS